MKKVKDFFKDGLEEIGRGILHEYGDCEEDDK